MTCRIQYEQFGIEMLMSYMTMRAEYRLLNITQSTNVSTAKQNKISLRKETFYLHSFNIFR
jgi:hypothetical protein